MAPLQSQHPIRRRLIAVNLLAPVVVVFTDFHLVAIAASCVIHSLLTYGLIHPLCDCLCPVATRFRTDKMEVWLTVDDGPDGRATEELLGILERYQAKATLVVERVKSQVFPGAIILLHEARYDACGDSISNRCIARVLEELTRMGYSFVIPQDEQLI